MDAHAGVPRPGNYEPGREVSLVAENHRCAIAVRQSRAMKLAHYTQGRDNNFNLIRIIAAFAVLVSHSFPLAMGPIGGQVEPLKQSLGTTLGTVAVDLFFIA